MPRPLWIAAATALAVAAAGVWYLLRDDSGIAPGMRTAPAIAAPEGAAMVPWRQPADDLKTLFPGAPTPDTGSPKIVSLSRHRRTLDQALGGDGDHGTLALYLYEIPGRGAVLVRRVRGGFGAIEVVVGVGADRRVAGVRVQRHREPPGVAAVLSSPNFLGSFRGKTKDSDFALPDGVPADARESAKAVADAVRTLLIEYDAGSGA